MGEKVSLSTPAGNSWEHVRRDLAPYYSSFHSRAAATGKARINADDPGMMMMMTLSEDDIERPGLRTGRTC